MPDGRDIDRDLDDLRCLAPDVDTDAARAEFANRRRDDRPPRWPLAAAAAVVLVLLAGGFAIAANDDGDDQPLATGADGDGSTSTSPDAPASNVGFDVLFTVEGSDPLGTLRAATSAEELDPIWLATGTPDIAPDVDFGEQTVVSITVPDNSCPAELTEISRAGDSLTPVFVMGPELQCTDQLIAWTHVVALDIRPPFTLRLPADDIYGYEEQLLRVDDDELGPAPTVFEPAPDVAATCEQIEAFAEVVARPAAIVDYDASESPAELADRSDLVLYGQLTGRTKADAGDVGDLPDDSSPPAFPTIGFEVEIDAVYKSPPGADLAPVVPISVTHVGPVDDIESAADTGVAGLPVAVFATHDAENSVFHAGVEGFVTACPDGPLLGFPFQGEWTTIPSLDALNARLEEYANP